MIYKIKKNIEFRIVYKRGKSIANDLLVLYIFKNKKNKDSNGALYNKVGISVSKKVGKAYARNKIKRVLRAIMRLNIDKVPNSKNYVVIARPSVVDLTYGDLEKELMQLFTKVN